LTFNFLTIYSLIVLDFEEINADSEISFIFSSLIDFIFRKDTYEKSITSNALKHPIFDESLRKLK